MKILSMNKTQLRSEYIFKKKKKILEILDNLLKELGFVEPPEHNLRDLICEKKGPRPKIKVKDLIDEVYSMSNKNYDIEIFIGFEKIVLVVRSKKDRQQEVSDIVFKFAEFKDK